jgi:prolipoprotein diacylglyceryltransferase
MRQILFTIPFKPFDWLPEWWPHEVPIYGFGMMLFITFLVTTWLASRRARQEGIAPQHLQDLAIWIFVGGLVGARLVYMKQYDEPLTNFFKIWQGGLVFYGSAIGGVAGYVLAYFFVIRKHGLSTWKLADIIAPSVAVGLLLGRIGCFLNGCCYGNVACTHCPGVAFPLSAPARYMLVGAGYQTAAGFTLIETHRRDGRTVAAVKPGSPAAESGLRAGDVLVKVGTSAGDQSGQSWDLSRRDVVERVYFLGSWSMHQPPPREVKIDLTVQREGKPVELPAFLLPYPGEAARFDLGFTMIDCTVDEVEPGSPAFQHGLRPRDVIVEAVAGSDPQGENDRPINFARDLDSFLGEAWPRGKAELRLTVLPAGGKEPVVLEPFVPRTLRLHPTQLYESISMALLFLVLISYYPFRRRDGMVMVLFILGYSVHRFLNEILRNDTDPVAFGMTLSQNGSILFFVVGLGLFVWLWRKKNVVLRSPTSKRVQQA